MSPAAKDRSGSKKCPASAAAVCAGNLSGQKTLIPDEFGAKIDGLVEACWVEVEEALVNRGFGAKSAKIHLAIHEALVNAWKHGNKKRSDLPVVFRWCLAEDFIFEVLDSGTGFCCAAAKDPRNCERLTAENGRGLFIIRACSEDVCWRENGRHIVVRFVHPSG